MLDGVMEDVMDGVYDRVCDRVWLFGKDSFEECPLTTTSSLSDTLPSTIPMLDAEGSNWAIFYIRFMDAIEAKGFWTTSTGHLCLQLYLNCQRLPKLQLELSGTRMRDQLKPYSLSGYRIQPSWKYIQRNW